MKPKIFYSYSHKDSDYRNNLEKYLAILKQKELIDEWYDEKINAGEGLNEEIYKNMKDSHIILLLFSADFIASDACQKEVKRTMLLKKEKGVIFIPIILKTCAWKDIDGISNIKALPKDGKPINEWKQKDKAWNNVYEGIKKQVQKIQKKIIPTLKPDFKDELLNNPVADCTLDKLFVYPDILRINKSIKKLEHNEIDSNKLCDITNFKYSHILI